VLTTASRAATGDHHARQTTASETRANRCRQMDKAVEAHQPVTFVGRRDEAEQV